MRNRRKPRGKAITADVAFRKVAPPRTKRRERFYHRSSSIYNSRAAAARLTYLRNHAFSAGGPERQSPLRSITACRIDPTVSSTQPEARGFQVGMTRAAMAKPLLISIPPASSARENAACGAVFRASDRTAADRDAAEPIRSAHAMASFHGAHYWSQNMSGIAVAGQLRQSVPGTRQPLTLIAALGQMGEMEDAHAVADGWRTSANPFSYVAAAKRTPRAASRRS